MTNNPSVLENLPDKVLRIALNIIKPAYSGDYDDLKNYDFTSVCDEVIRMTSLRDNDYGEIEDFSFLYELLTLNPDFESLPDEPLIRPNFNQFTIEWEVEERRTHTEVYQHSSGSYNSDGSDLPNLFSFTFMEGYDYPMDGVLISDSQENIDTELIDDYFVTDSIKKI